MKLNEKIVAIAHGLFPLTIGESKLLLLKMITPTKRQQCAPRIL